MKYCPRHTGVKGNETADRLADSAQHTPGMQVLLDNNAVEIMVGHLYNSSQRQSAVCLQSHTCLTV